ncbi:LacI family DNA-binding transcriptional regulator [uncultured Devosia sp.]|uniref:LacI family DNA-binding transcriptional regulator n=1 Tax=uncultured Devosia sp. TaxID=211434 RepID=UPI0035CC2105
MMPKKKSERVTIRTVAEDAGVSVAAVSKVLRDAYGVSEALRAKVQASMTTLGYRPHAAARGMRGQTYTLGVLFSDIRNPFFADIMSGVNSALERTQYQPLLGISNSGPSNELAIVNAMIDRQMDGLILVAPRMASLEASLIAERVPIVMIGHHERAATDLDTVNNDDALGAGIVVRHLAEGGHRKIAFLNIQLELAHGFLVTTQREIGYRATMTELGLGRNIHVLYAEQTVRDTQTAIKHLLASKHRPDAIFCWTDFIAFQALSVARDMGLSVPGDVAIVGYDNTTDCDLAQNALTSIDQSGQVLGLQSARLLIERIKGRTQAEHFVVTPRLVVRGSSKARSHKGADAEG